MQTTNRDYLLNRNNVHFTKSSNSDRTLVFANGFGCNQTMWSLVATNFEKECDVVLFDYVGSGKSDVSAFDRNRYVTLDGYVRDLIEMCDVLELKNKVTYIGHSIGCSIGALAAIRRPDLFSDFVFVGPNPYFIKCPPEYDGGFSQADLRELLALLDQNYIGWAEYLAPVVSGQGSESQVTTILTESFCSTDPVFARLFAEASFFSDNREDFKKLTVPSLILQHARDALAPLAVGEFLNQHMKHARLEVLDVVGHCAHMSHPQLVIDAIKQFIADPA